MSALPMPMESVNVLSVATSPWGWRLAASYVPPVDLVGSLESKLSVYALFPLRLITFFDIRPTGKRAAGGQLDEDRARHAAWTAGSVGRANTLDLRIAGADAVHGDGEAADDLACCIGKIRDRLGVGAAARAAPTRRRGLELISLVFELRKAGFQSRFGQMQGLVIIVRAKVQHILVRHVRHEPATRIVSTPDATAAEISAEPRALRSCLDCILAPHGMLRMSQRAER